MSRRQNLSKKDNNPVVSSVKTDVVKTVEKTPVLTEDNYVDTHQSKSIVSNETINKIISKMQEDAKSGKKDCLDNRRKSFYVKVMFHRRHYYITIPKLCKMLRMPSIMKLLRKKRLSIVIIEFDEEYVLYHSLKNYVNVGGNILELVTSQIYPAQERHLYHKLKSVSRKENKIKLTTTDGSYKKFEVDAYTIKAEDIELGTVICKKSSIIESSRYPVDDSFKLPIPFDLIFCSEQSSKSESKSRLEALNTMDSKIENVLDVAINNRTKTSCSNYDDKKSCSKADTSFETNIIMTISSFKDVKQALSSLFENSRLVFVKQSDLELLTCREPELYLNGANATPDQRSGGEGYHLACYDYISESYKIGVDSNSYFCKFRRFLNGKHIGQNVDGNGSDTVNPDSVFINYCISNKNLLYQYNEQGEKVFIEDESDNSDYNFTEHINSIFSDIPNEVTERVVDKLEDYRNLGINVSSTKRTLNKFKPVDKSTAEKYKVSKTDSNLQVNLNPKNSELTCGNLKLNYMSGYDGLYLDASKYNLTDHTFKLKSQILNSPCEVFNYELDDFKVDAVKISDYLKLNSDFHPEEVKTIENYLDSNKPKHSFGLMDTHFKDKFKLLTYCYSQFSDIIISQFIFNLVFMDEIHYEYIVTNPTYFIELVAAENKIVLGDIIDNIEEKLARFKESVKDDVTIIPISSITRKNVDDLVKKVYEKLKTLPKTEPIPVEQTELAVKDITSINITKLDEHVFEVSGGYLDNLQRGIVFNDNQSLAYFQQRLEKDGVMDKLKEAGCVDGDTVVFGSLQYEIYFE